MLGELLSFGSSIVGGLTSANSAENATHDNIAYAREKSDQDYARQKEFAQNGIQWRVDDAVKAGLHPLFALGGGGASYAPSSTAVTFDDGGKDLGRSISEMGQNVSRAALASQSAEIQKRQVAISEALAAAATTKDYAQAEYYNSMAARARGEFNQSGPAMGDSSGWVTSGNDVVHQGTPNTPGQTMSPFFDRRQVKPSEVVSANSDDPASEAGTSPHWKTYTLNSKGMLIQLPAGSGPSEAYESMAESKTLLGFVIGRNVEKYGAKWLVEFMKSYGHLFTALSPVGSYEGSKEYSGSSNMGPN